MHKVDILHKADTWIDIRSLTYLFLRFQIRLNFPYLKKNRESKEYNNKKVEVKILTCNILLATYCPTTYPPISFVHYEPTRIRVNPFLFPFFVCIQALHIRGVNISCFNICPIRIKWTKVFDYNFITRLVVYFVRSSLITADV